MNKKLTKEKEFEKWVNHMNGVKIDSELEMMGVGLAFNRIRSGKWRSKINLKRLLI